MNILNNSIIKKVIVSLAAIFMALIPATTANAVSGYNGTNISPNGDGITYNVVADSGDTVNLVNVAGIPGMVVSVTFNSNVNGTIVITSSNTRPADAPVSAPGTTEMYFDVTLNGISNSQITSATWNFAVPKTWANQNGFGSGNIAMMHYGTSWVQLTTTLTSQDANNYYYSAVVTSFSPFAIVGSNGLANTGTPYVLVALASLGLIVVVGALYITTRQKGAKAIK